MSYSHPSRRITIPLIASQRAIHRRETPRAVNSRGKKRVPRWKKQKKKRGGGKKIGVRQSMGGRVKRPLTIPFPRAINRTIAANAVNRSNRMFQLHDTALKFGRFHACPRNRSPFLRVPAFFRLSRCIFLKSFDFHKRSMTSSIRNMNLFTSLWLCEIFGTKSILYFLHILSLWQD